MIDLTKVSDPLTAALKQFDEEKSRAYDLKREGKTYESGQLVADAGVRLQFAVNDVNKRLIKVIEAKKVVA